MIGRGPALPRRSAKLTHMEWWDAGPLERLTARGKLEMELADRALLLLAVGGGVRAVAAICPHHAAWLIDGAVGETFIDCPRHQGRFDLTTGAKLRGPECPSLPVYPARVREGRVEVQLSRNAARP
jgi:nitrite reductase/ring-hydroxylating ferredoxin subunit